MHENSRICGAMRPSVGKVLSRATLICDKVSLMRIAVPFAPSALKLKVPASLDLDAGGPGPGVWMHSAERTTGSNKTGLHHTTCAPLGVVQDVLLIRAFVLLIRISNIAL